MKLSILAAPPVPNHGWGRYTRDMIVALDQAGVQITLITSSDAPADPHLPLVAYHRVLPSLIQPRRLNSLRMLRCAPLIRYLTEQADAVHIFAEPYALAASLVRRPVWITAHGTYIPFSSSRRGLGTVFSAFYRHIYQRSRIACVSGYTERQIKAALPNAQTCVILNGVDVARYQPDQQAGLSPDKRGLTVLAVGQVKARKGYHILAQAMLIVHQQFPDVQAILIGDTSDAAYVALIRAQLEADQLTDVVHLLGRVPDDVLLGWYEAADLFALPALNVGGKFEGFGLVYLEASAAGLPVIGTRDCGAEEAIREGLTGLLVPQNDPAATAQAIIQLLGDSELRARMGAAGRAHAQQHSWATVAAQMVAFYGS